MAEDLSVAINALNNQIANVGGMALAAQANKHQQKRAIEYNWEMAKWQNATNIENWKMQNEYNSPSAQMQRLQEAGLNPNLVYDKGATTTASSLPAAPSAGQYPRIDYNQYAQMLNNQVLDNAMKMAGIEKTQQETANLSSYQRNLNLDGDMKELRLIAQNYSNAKSEAEAKIWKSYLDYKLKIMDSSDALNIKRIEDINSNIDYRNHVLTPLGRANVSNISARTALTNSDLLLVPYRINKAKAEIAQIVANTSLTEEQKRLVGQQLSNLAQDFINKSLDADSKRIGIKSQELEYKMQKILKRYGLNPNSNTEGGLIDKLFYNILNLGEE